MILFTGDSDVWVVIAVLLVVLIFFSVLIVRGVKLMTMSYKTMNLSQ